MPLCQSEYAALFFFLLDEAPTSTHMELIKSTAPLLEQTNLGKIPLGGQAGKRTHSHRHSSKHARPGAECECRWHWHGCCFTGCCLSIRVFTFPLDVSFLIPGQRINTWMRIHLHARERTPQTHRHGSAYFTESMRPSIRPYIQALTRTYGRMHQHVYADEKRAGVLSLQRVAIFSVRSGTESLLRVLLCRLHLSEAEDLSYRWRYPGLKIKIHHVWARWWIQI